MFQTWFQTRGESSNELLLVFIIVIVVLAAFVSLVLWIVRLAKVSFYGFLNKKFLVEFEVFTML